MAIMDFYLTLLFSSSPSLFQLTEASMGLGNEIDVPTPNLITETSNFMLKYYGLYPSPYK